MLNKRKNLGFTLIELMITVAIISIIVAIALPNYQSYLQKTRRVDAANALLRIQAEQEKYYLDNNAYMSDGNGTGSFVQVNNNKKWFKLVGGAVLSDNQFYNIVITQDVGRPFTESFLATATAVTGGLQEKDTDCNNLSINGSGQRTAEKLVGSTSTPNNDECWK